VAILLSEILGMNPVPLLVAMALLSNTGGAGTLIGDPPNILIGSAAGLSFNDFLFNALPIVIAAWIVVLGLLLYLFRSELRENAIDVEAVQKLNPARALDDRVTAMKILTVLGAAILLLFLQDLLGLSSSFIALAAASVALMWIRPDMHDLFERIEWNVLMFFMALFVVVGGLEAAGVLDAIADAIAGAADLDPVLLGVAMIWVVAILSAIVDNIPVTIALIPVVLSLVQKSG
jgi:Na+/H+ antiporter NhaD/arsenite permease-like protein